MELLGTDIFWALSIYGQIVLQKAFTHSTSYPKTQIGKLVRFNMPSPSAEGYKCRYVPNTRRGGVDGIPLIQIADIFGCLFVCQVLAKHVSYLYQVHLTSTLYIICHYR